MGLVFNAIHTHMIDDFHPTAQFGGWQGIQGALFCLLTSVSCTLIAHQGSAIQHFPYFFLLWSSAVQPFCIGCLLLLMLTPGAKAPCVVGGLKQVLIFMALKSRAVPLMSDLSLTQ